ncbi:MAG: hypothetical protein AAFP03_12110, partial [Cyanobacteria bacterium J06598_3]
MTHLKNPAPSSPSAYGIASVPAQPPFPASVKSVVLAAMCLALFMTNFDGTAGDVALPQIQKNFGTNMAGVQWFLNAYHL